jgi:uncharacterized protein YutE (UPF0331/DUF86 family)
MNKEVDQVRVRELMGNMNDALRRLRELGQLSEKDFLADYHNTESAKYLLIVATAATIDLCNHIAARQGGRAPQDYADCFAVLLEMGAIDDRLAKSLQQMSRFRNLLVHVYGQVDNRLVYRVIQEDLDDLDAFQQALLDWMGS